ncbi:MAG TPA: hypothetical protein VGS22_07325 [Thermoanaerobaculia bacterium]|nr:hypothetical protein [Thermoanaerobaculia bacterium]
MSDGQRSHHLPDSDMEAVLPALARAAQRAREIARQTGTAIFVERNGKSVEEKLPPGESGRRPHP